MHSSQVENIPAFIAGVKAKKEKLFGFGHRVYRNFDPRAKIIKEVRNGRSAESHDSTCAARTSLHMCASGHGPDRLLGQPGPSGAL